MGLIVLDTGVVIAVLDRSDAHHVAARAAVDDARASGDLVIPASAFAEALVHPSRRGPEAVATVEGFVDALPIDVAPLTRDIARTAAAIRAKHTRLKLPDALVVATALAHDADRLVTTDRRWPRRSDLGLRGLIVLRE